MRIKLGSLLPTLTARQMRRLRNWGRPFHHRTPKPRNSFSRQELLDYLKRTGTRSWRVLERNRVDGDPITGDFRKEFGTWKNAVEAALGPTITPLKTDALYVLRAVPFYNAWTYHSYIAARRLSPHVLPSMNFIRRTFGKFSTFIALAREMNLKKATDDYRALSLKMGKRPTIPECEAAGLNLGFALDFFGGKPGLDNFADGIQGQKLPRKEFKVDAQP